MNQMNRKFPHYVLHALVTTMSEAKITPIPPSMLCTEQYSLHNSIFYLHFIASSNFQAEYKDICIKTVVVKFSYLGLGSASLRLLRICCTHAREPSYIESALSIPCLQGLRLTCLTIINLDRLYKIKVWHS